MGQGYGKGRYDTVIEFMSKEQSTVQISSESQLDGWINSLVPRCRAMTFKNFERAEPA